MKMKIQPAHYQHIKTQIAAHIPELRAHRETLKDDNRVKDLEKRLRWDAAYVFVGSAWMCDNLDSYMDNTHVDTALCAVMRELEI